MFLANENLPRPSIQLLREKGYLVRSIQEELPGIDDEQVIELASSLNLIILTFDSDYGEIIFKYNRKNPPAVIYFREKGNDPLFAATMLLSLLSDPAISFSDSFTVIDEKNIRQRFYQK